MPIPREGTPVTNQVVGNPDLCDILCGGHMGNRVCSLPCSVQKNVSPETILCLTAIKTDAILKPTSMISIHIPAHFSNLSSCVVRHDGARSHHLLSRLPGDSVVIVSGTNVPTVWSGMLVGMCRVCLSVGFATPNAFASAIANHHISRHRLCQPSMAGCPCKEERHC